jgi:cephalosporin-C deacetylase-like acetyl esterase
VAWRDAQGQSLNALGGAGVDPLLIKPSLEPPDDLEAFWTAQKQKLAAVPMKAHLTPATSPSEKVEVFDVQVDALGAPASGYFARPTGARPKSLPAFLMVHGAGVTSGSLTSAVSWAENGALALNLNAHGLPNGKPPEFYKELSVGALKGYPLFGREAKETCYFLGMFLREVRAIDFLCAQPEWDGKTVVVFGSSQGGFQAFAAAGIDERVTFFAAGVPAGCDHTGVLAGRVNGWPKLVPTLPPPDAKPDPKVLETARYFDNVNFATHTKAEGAYVTVGFIDGTCPPTTVYAAYNALPIPKGIYNDVPTGHANSPAAVNAMIAAVKKHFADMRGGRSE